MKHSKIWERVLSGSYKQCLQVCFLLCVRRPVQGPTGDLPVHRMGILLGVCAVVAGDRRVLGAVPANSGDPRDR